MEAYGSELNRPRNRQRRGSGVEESGFCTRCGALATSDNAFCGKCGASLSSADASPASPLFAAPIPVTSRSVSRRSFPTWAKLFAAVVVIAALVGVGSYGYYQFGRGAATPTPTPTPTPLTHTVTGVLALMDSGLYSSGITTTDGQCEGAGGYSDIGAGTPVTLKDEHGTILASTTLGHGTGSTSALCWFPYTLTDVPDTASFYSIEIGRRGSISESHDELKDAGWQFSTTMGS